MGDPPRLQRQVKTDKPGQQTISYEIHVDIDVKAPVLDEKRLSQLIDDRIRRLASTLKNQAR